MFTEEFNKIKEQIETSHSPQNVVVFRFYNDLHRNYVDFQIFTTNLGSYKCGQLSKVLPQRYHKKEINKLISLFKKNYLVYKHKVIMEDGNILHKIYFIAPKNINRDTCYVKFVETKNKIEPYIFSSGTLLQLPKKKRISFIKSPEFVNTYIDDIKDIYETYNKNPNQWPKYKKFLKTLSKEEQLLVRIYEK